MSVLTVEDLHVAFRRFGLRTPVLRGVTFAIEPGEVCGLVGESGAGKSMVGKAILGLLPHTARVRSGRIQLDDLDLLAMSERQLSRVRGHRVALIPQDPMVSLNPVRRIGTQMVDGIRLHVNVSETEARRTSLDLLDDVLIKDPERVLKAYPHELSGGMRQRVLIAMAFSCNPDLIIADEPTTALDVTVQRRVLSLLKRLQRERNTAVLFVTHDLGVVAHVCDRVVVLYDGRVLEDTPTHALLTQPEHAYTAALLDATPRYDRPDKPLQPVPEHLIEELARQTHELDARGRG